ncbi:MAG: acetate/propionate family kinase, partial [Solirubrobacterales bacterium]
MQVLTVNAGSSSLKLRLLDPDDRLQGSVDLAVRGGEIDADELDRAVSGMPAPDAVGHRVVHGGKAFRGPVKITPDVERALRELTDLAPLHQQKSLAALDAVTGLLPHIPAVACFDTAFHATLPAAASTYALPREWRERYGLRRYGFHGLSHAYTARRAAEMLDRPDLRLVTCHLGAGASLAAVRGGESLDTTMGFTPLEGLVMATRSGSIDPGLLLWLLQRHSVSEREMA